MLHQHLSLLLLTKISLWKCLQGASLESIPYASLYTVSGSMEYIHSKDDLTWGKSWSVQILNTFEMTSILTKQPVSSVVRELSVVHLGCIIINNSTHYKYSMLCCRCCMSWHTKMYGFNNMLNMMHSWVTSSCWSWWNTLILLTTPHRGSS